MTRRLFTPLFAAMALIAAPSLAQGGESAFFTAQLAAPAADAQFAAGGVVWTCEGTQCRAARSNARPIRVCSSLRREVGAITGFAVNGAALAAEELARCNG